MIRSLLMIALGGFVLCIASLSAAVAIGGPDAIARGAWHWAPWVGSDRDDWDWDNEGGRGPWSAASGPTVTRELAWSGHSEVEFDVPADITYTQAEGPPKLVISGPQSAVEDVEVRQERVRFDNRRHRGARLTITMTAPNVRSFGLNGSQRLTIENYRQERLGIDVNGSAEVTARGQATEVDVEISGSGRADLAQLTTEAADVDISGSGEARVAPTRRARLEISGSGEIDLLTRPSQVESNVSGSGNIRQGAFEGPTPPPTPATPAAPAAPEKKTNL